MTRTDALGQETLRLPIAPRSRGVVMVIALLAIVLIASLLFYVINVGTSVQGRVVTQHTADAVAIGGASQVARSMNTVAMNNVETARLIAAVSILDGLPLAVDMSITDATEENLGDTDALAIAAAAQLRSGVVDVWFKTLLQRMMDEADSQSVVSEQRYLRELDDLSRSVVVLREVEGLSYEEISQVLDVPLPTVKTRLLRARRVLATALEGWKP